MAALVRIHCLVAARADRVRRDSTAREHGRVDDCAQLLGREALPSAPQKAVLPHAAGAQCCDASLDAGLGCTQRRNNRTHFINTLDRRCGQNGPASVKRRTPPRVSSRARPSGKLPGTVVRVTWCSARTRWMTRATVARRPWRPISRA